MPELKKILVGVMASGMPRVLKLWLGVSRDTLPVDDQKISILVAVKCYGGNGTVTMLR